MVSEADLKLVEYAHLTHATEKALGVKWSDIKVTRSR